jgi:hypothetical protein
MPSEDSPIYRDPPNLRASHLLTCRSIWYDNFHPENGFSLGGIHANMVLPDGHEFPYKLERIFVYLQLWGDSGEYHLRIRLVKIESNEEDDFSQAALEKSGEHREFLLTTSRPVFLSGVEFAIELASGIGPVMFPESGVYEYQLFAEGIEEPIGRERVHIEE